MEIHFQYKDGELYLNDQYINLNSYDVVESFFYKGIFSLYSLIRCVQNYVELNTINFEV